MPPGGLAELKRRKKEAERAASGGGEAVDSSASAVEPVAEQKPGELQHVSMGGSCVVPVSYSLVVVPEGDGFKYPIVKHISTISSKLGQGLFIFAPIHPRT